MGPLFLAVFFWKRLLLLLLRFRIILFSNNNFQTVIQQFHEKFKNDSAIACVNKCTRRLKKIGLHTFLAWGS